MVLFLQTSMNSLFNPTPKGIERICAQCLFYVFRKKDKALESFAF